MVGVREVNNEYIFIILNYETNDNYLTDQLKSRKKTPSDQFKINYIKKFYCHCYFMILNDRFVVYIQSLGN
jgi:hypothetical protein